MRAQVESMIYEAPPAIAALGPADLEALRSRKLRVASADTPRLASARSKLTPS